MRILISLFFFQAEDGIRDVAVTGVQTCALPISRRGDPGPGRAYAHRTADDPRMGRRPGRAEPRDQEAARAHRAPAGKELVMSASGAISRRGLTSPVGRGRIAPAIRVRGYAPSIDRTPSPQPSPHRSRIYPTSTS